MPAPSNARPLKHHPLKTGTPTTKWSPAAQAARPAGQIFQPGPIILSRKNTTTPAKNTSAILIPGSRFTSGTRSVAAT